MNEMEKAVADVIIHALRASDAYRDGMSPETVDHAMETLRASLDRWSQMAHEHGRAEQQGRGDGEQT